MSNETARPWELSGNQIWEKNTATCVLTLNEGDNYSSSSYSDKRFLINNANAKLIVKAVNAYDELIAENTALQAKVKEQSELIGELNAVIKTMVDRWNSPKGSWTYHTVEIISRMETLLAKQKDTTNE